MGSTPTPDTEQPEKMVPCPRCNGEGRLVVSQRLVPKIGGGRVPLIEIMGANLRTQETIRLGETEGKSFYEIIEASTPFGWRTFDFSALEGYEQGKITEETALLYCTKRGTVSRGMDTIKKTRGESTTTMNSLRMKAGRDAVKAGVPPVPATLKDHPLNEHPRQLPKGEDEMRPHGH